MKTNIITAVCSATLLLNLTACGGGGGDGSSAAAPAAVTQTTVAPEPVVVQAPVIESTSDLDVSDAFTFQAKPSEVSLQVNTDTRFDYVTVCSLVNATTVNVNDCMLRAPLVDGVLATTFSITGGTQALGAVLWDYDDLTNRPEFLWSSADGVNFSIN